MVSLRGSFEFLGELWDDLEDIANKTMVGHTHDGAISILWELA